MSEKTKPGETEELIKTWQDSRIILEQMGSDDNPWFSNHYFIATLNIPGFPPGIGVYPFDQDRPYNYPFNIHPLEMPYRHPSRIDTIPFSMQINAHKYQVYQQNELPIANIFEEANYRMFTEIPKDDYFNEFESFNKLLREKTGDLYHLTAGYEKSRDHSFTHIVLNYNLPYSRSLPFYSKHLIGTASQNELITKAILPHVAFLKQREVDVQPLSSRAFTAQLQQMFPQSVSVSH